MRSAPVSTFRPQLEGLEDRAVPTTVAATFPGAGLFRFPDGGGWRFLTPFTPTDFAVADNGYVVGSFTGFGLYRFQDGDFQQLSPFTPAANDLSINSAGEVAADFTGVGVFEFDGGDDTGF